MPWLRVTPMTARLAFVEDCQRGLESMSALCAQYGISRRVGYKWLARYAAAGEAGLVDQRRVAKTCPHRLDPALAAALLDCRRSHPTWGPLKLLAYLQRRQPRTPWPAPSTVGVLLKAHGMIAPRRRRASPGHPGRPQTPMDAPNAVWTVDFKGQFRTGDGRYCYPLTVVDGYSRYLLACHGLLSPETAGVFPVFTRLFREHGLPQRIRSDNGVPFATSALGRLSALSVWWLKLGITPELIEPAAPQQNGRHERMHKTLKAETTRPPAATLAAQQRRFTAYRQHYNTERPHAALGQTPPAEHYAPSVRALPSRVDAPSYPGHWERRLVSTNGGMMWGNRRVNVSHVLAGETIGLDEIDDGIWRVYFAHLLLGCFDEREGRIRGAHNRNRLERRRDRQRT